MLGQLQNKDASAALSNILMDRNEHPMVRHEAAEALGSIAGMTAWYLSNCVLQAYLSVYRVVADRWIFCYLLVCLSYEVAGNVLDVRLLYSI